MTSDYEPCKCSKCGAEQNYEIVLTFCDFMADMLPSNKCYKCGNQLTRKDIQLDKASKPYQRCIREDLIQDRMTILNGEPLHHICEKCGSTNTGEHHIFTVGDKELEKNNYYQYQDVISCSDCGYENNVTTYDDYNDLYDFIKMNSEGYIILKHKYNFDELLKSQQKQINRLHKRAERQLIKEGIISRKIQ